jgi:hypothetical protein
MSGSAKPHQFGLRPCDGIGLLRVDGDEEPLDRIEHAVGVLRVERVIVGPAVAHVTKPEHEVATDPGSRLR